MVVCVYVCLYLHAGAHTYVYVCVCVSVWICICFYLYVYPDILEWSFTFRAALETIDRLTDTLDLTDYASRIIHPLVRTLDTTSDLHKPAMDTLTSLVVQLGMKYQIFIPMVNKVLTKHRISHQGYDKLLSKIIKVMPLV